MNFSEEIRKMFNQGTSLTKLILINLGVFLVLKVVSVFFFLFQNNLANDTIIRFLALPADISTLASRPWTIFTYMFLHEGFLHILFNMLWLFWFGKIFLEYLDQKKLLSVYLLGGLAGGALYILAYNVFPAFQQTLPISIALGASAAVMGIVMTISFYVPEYKINLMFVGPVKLKHMAIAVIIIDILSVQGGNAGGHIAHLGGALFGFLYASQMKKGKDISRGFNRMMDWFFSLFKRRSNLKVKYRKPAGKPETDMDFNKRKADEQHEIDRILEKISKSGYDALSKAEKDILFRSSKK